MTVQHAKNPKTGKRGYDEWNFEAFPTQTGCYAQLEITLHPTDVSFHHTEVEETHLKNVPDTLPELADQHEPLDIAADVNRRNVFIDNIGISKNNGPVQESASGMVVDYQVQHQPIFRPHRRHYHAKTTF